MSNEENVTYVVINDQWGAEAAGPLDKCLTYVSQRLTAQSEQQSLINPSGYRVKKVKCL